MKKQIVQRSAGDMLDAFQYKLYEMKANSCSSVTASDDDFEYHGWTELASKSVMDSDGFYTDYTLYELGDGDYGCIFGDKDAYTPDTAYLDFECDDRQEAFEWFDNFVGFDESGFM